MSTNHRRAARIATYASALLLAACAHRPSPPITIDPGAAYDGPAIEAGVTERQHTLSIVAPTGGWDVIGERVDREFRDNRVFLTIVRPDPEAMHTQALVEFDVTPGVSADEPLAVYARVVDHDEARSGAPFALARSIGPKRD